MQPFKQGSLPFHEGSAAEIAARCKCTLAEAEAHIKASKESLVAMNDTYQVLISKVKAPFGEANGDMAWLSIKRRDKEVIHDWREMQEIKNLIVGPENEGFEIYPAESRLVDTSNQYHLWVFVNPKVRMPVGWAKREVLTPEQIEGTGAKQRAFK